MGNYIKTEKLYYALGEKMTVSGDVKTGILPAFEYTAFIGSAAGENEIPGKLTASQLKSGVQISLDGNYIVHASPYGEGRLCYIKVRGKRKPVFGDEETVEYTTYINLKGDLLPEFEVGYEVSNTRAPGFGNTPVKGFSKVTVTVTPKKKTFCGKTQRIQLTGGIFSHIEDGDKESYSMSLDPISVAGNIFVTAALTSEHGYTTTETKEIKVFDYKSPTLSFSLSPARYDGDNRIETSEADKSQTYELRFTADVKPVEMLVDEKQLCTITEIKGAVLTEIGTERKASIELNETVNGNGSITVSYSGKPEFFVRGEKVDKAGLQIFKAYKLEITCTDTGGMLHILTTRIKTLGTAFHLGEGGNKAKFGGYATEENTLASEWDIHAEKDIRADGEIKGNMFRVTNGIYFSDDESARAYVGVGTEGNTLSEGNHRHGNIRGDGYLEEGGRLIKNAILLTDESGYIIYAEKLTADQLVIGKDSDMRTMTKDGNETATVGTPGKGLCYADHIHPYSDRWKTDEAFLSFVRMVDDLQGTAQVLANG